MTSPIAFLSKPLSTLLVLALAGCATVRPAGDASAPAAAREAAATADADKSAASAAEKPGTSSAAQSAGQGHATPGATAARPAAPTAAPVPGQPRPFAEVVKDAKESKGLLGVWQKDDKVWLEIDPALFGKPLFFSVNLARGLGESWIFGGMMGRSHLVEFRKVGSNVQLVARNDRYFAQPGTPEARGVAESFTESLVTWTPVASQPHPERKSVLVEASSLLFADIPGAHAFLDRTYRQPYSFDARNSSVGSVRTGADAVAIQVNAHYAVSRLSQPPAAYSPGASVPSVPSTVPDARSLFLGFQYNFAKLPDEPMRPRAADPRLGHFTASRFDYSSDDKLSPYVSFVQRWRLEKKDPQADVSEPKQPIVFWIDRNVPVRYREVVVAGVVEWNKAFERIGFKDAIQAKVQPDDAEFDTLDARVASIRWMTTARPAFGGIGPRQVDPRSGEILDADIGIDPVRLRHARYGLADQRASVVPAGAPAGLLPDDALQCRIADFVAEDRGFALDLLAARGAIAPRSAEAEAFVLSDLKEVVMHEVGHALGLTHNFRASTIYTRAQLADREFTRTHGVSGSVMEYTPINLALRGESQGEYSMSTLGPYDYWAIEYAYRPLAPEEEAAELARIAARSSEPQLAFALDEETSAGLDPEASEGDLGSDPLAYAARRLALAKELWERWEARPLEPGESYAALRRNVTRGVVQVRGAGVLAARYVGGISVLRDAAGSGRTPMNPVSMAKQREALKLIETGVFAVDSFRFKPEFLRSLSTDFADRHDAYESAIAPGGLDYSLPLQVLAAQRAVLDRLMSESVAQRLLDAEGKVDDPAQALKLAEVYATLRRAIWSDLKAGGDVPLIRRNLQREHAVRVSTALLRPSATMPADQKSLLRAEARLLRADLAAASGRPGWTPTTSAHLAESLAVLDEALKAPVVRQAL